MKKFLKAILFLCALSSLAYADEAAPVVAEGKASTMSAEEQKDAMDILDRMRARIEKEEEEKAKLAAEARELGIKPGDVKSVEEVEAMVEAKKLEEAKPKTEAEKVELTRKKALNKLDFYERVGELISIHVIPRPHTEIEAILPKAKTVEEAVTE